MTIGPTNIPLTGEERALWEDVRKFVVQDIRPCMRSAEQERQFPESIWTKLAEFDLTGLDAPKKYGGLDVDRTVSAALHEELAYGGLSVSMALAAHTLATACIAEFGSPDVCSEWLPKMVDGRPVGAFCLSESQAGSNPAEMTTTASQDGDMYVLNGKKRWVSNGRRAGVYIVFAKTATSDDGGITQFLVPADYDGVTVGESERTMGVRACETTELVFEEVRLPKRYRLTETGQGLSAAFQILTNGRITSAAQSVGLARGAFNAARDYADSHERRDIPLTETQAVRHKFAEMTTHIRAARLLVQDAARRADVGENHEMAASIAKYFASETAVDVANEAILIHGMHGSLREYDVERFYRDAKPTTIYEGSTEIQKEIIARWILS